MSNSLAVGLIIGNVFLFVGAVIGWVLAPKRPKVAEVPDSARTSLIALTRKYATDIANGRTYLDVYDALCREHQELKEEISDERGPDGVVGECVDNILCLLDLIFVYDPSISDQEIMDIADKKCAKWARRYAMSVEGDRTIS